jgi:P-type Ca2+ transporter type 2C
VSAFHQSAKAAVNTSEASADLDPAEYPYAVSLVALAQAFDVDFSIGLGSTEILERRQRFGPNAIQNIRPPSAWRILLKQFGGIIIALLGIAALIAWVTGDHVESLAIIIVLLINALVGFVTEWKAERALEALRKQVRATARVRRDGHEKKIDAAELVPGDVIVLNAGDRVPADARVIKSGRLRADESLLTGESIPVEKSSEPVPVYLNVVERPSMLYLGTTVTSGRAIAIVTATGMHTELGRIGRLVAEAPQESTLLERRLSKLGHRLVYLVLLLATVVMIAGWLRGDGLWLMAEVAISLAVAAVPEALPAVTTLILALGVVRMATQNAIVRRLQAVETLGSTSIICTDKTGTLTQNKMTVREYYLAGGCRIHPDDLYMRARMSDAMTRTIRASVLCNEAGFSVDLSAIGDPTETALIVSAAEAGVDIVQLRAEHPKIIEIPFDPSTRQMITVHSSPTNGYLAVMKGAPAVLLRSCAYYLDSDSSLHLLDSDASVQFQQINEEMADRAMRVLGLAEKTLDGIGDGFTIQSLPELESEAHLENGFTFLGLVAMTDPPRPEVREALSQANRAGIRVVMLTGDQAHTAQAIANELQLNGKTEARTLHARDLNGATHERLVELAHTADVFARVSPEDKVRIVDARVRSGEIVAVTGDGINDAPALKRASIGISMGARGTEVAKEASDLVLADDNFATILKAVEGGRTIYSNIIKFVHLMFSKNLAEVLVIFVSIVMGWPLPLLPLQILWMNVVTDVSPAMALSVEPPSRKVMERAPRPASSALISRGLLVLIVWQAALLALITLSAYGWALSSYGVGAHARTVALMSIIGVQLGHMFNCRSRTRSAFEALFRNPFIWLASAIVVALQLIAIYVNSIARMLDTTPLTSTDWLIAGMCVVSPILIVELIKMIERRKRGSSPVQNALLKRC